MAPRRLDAMTLPRTSRIWLLGVGQLALAVSVAPAAPARANPARAALDFSSRGCLDEPTLVAAVEARLARPVFVAASDADVRLSVRLTRAGPAWQARVRLHRGAALLGVRRVGGSCESLRRSLPIVVALIVDVERLSVTLTEPDAESVRASSPPSARPRTQTEDRPSSRILGLGWGLRVGGAVELGLFPEPAGAVHATLLIEPLDRLVLELRGGVVPPFDFTRGERQVTSWAAMASVAACGVPHRDAFSSLSLCGAVGAGAAQVTGRGFAVDRSAWGGLGRVQARARAALRLLGPLELGLEASLGAPFVRPQYVVRSSERAERVIAEGGPVAGTVSVSLGLRSP